MVKNIVFFSVVLLCFHIFLTHASADIRINEFLIDPSQSVEIINTASGEADISNWFLDDSGGSTYMKLPDKSIIPGNSCLVFTSDLNLNKSSADTIRLFDATAPPTSQSAKLMDSSLYSFSPGSGVSFGRIPDGTGNFATQEASLGKFNESKLTCLPLPTTTPSPTPTPLPISISNPTVTSPQPTLTIMPTYHSLFLSEVYPYPAPSENEWVEIYNGNNFEVRLSDWFIDDGELIGSAPISFSVTIPQYGYAVVTLKKSMLNNTGDVVRLLDPQKSAIDEIEYGKAKREMSFSRSSFDEDIFCMTNPTPNNINEICSVDALGEPPESRTIASSISPGKQILKIVPTITPVRKQYQFRNTKRTDILGISTQRNAYHQNEPDPSIQSLSFASSLLSLASLISFGIRSRFGI